MPATKIFGRTFLVIKNPAVITAPFPILTPFKIVALIPIQTIFPIFISLFGSLLLIL
jgi:hypothetical protein